MKVLVTGGAGFIGSNIVDKLIEENYEVIIIDDLSTGKEEHINEKAKFYKADISSKEINDIFEKENINIVIHTAAQIDVQKSISNPIYDCKNNIIGTLNILEACKKHKIEKLVYSSSAAVYGQPDYLPVDEEHPINAMSGYGISKHTPEHYIKMYSDIYELNASILRYSNVYGPRQDPKGEGGVISIFVDKMLDNEKPIIYGDGEQTRDFIYVEDIVSANLAAINKDKTEVYNISCNKKNSINDLATIINKILDTNFSPIYKEARPGDIRHSVLDNNKALNSLAWKPQYDLEQGLKETITYYK